MPNEEKDGKAKGSAAAPSSLLVDVRALAKILVDLPPGETQGMSHEQEGFAAVLHEILTNQKEGWGAKAGIGDKDVAELQELTSRLAQIREQLPAAKKLVEVLEESEALYDDQRHMLIREMANSVDNKAPRVGDELVAKYEETRKYRSAIANKGARTKRKKEAEAKAEAEKKKAAEPAENG